MNPLGRRDQASFMPGRAYRRESVEILEDDAERESEL